MHTVFVSILTSPGSCCKSSADYYSVCVCMLYLVKCTQVDFKKSLQRSVFSMHFNLSHACNEVYRAPFSYWGLGNIL